MNSPHVILRGVKREFADNTGLHETDLSINRGEFISILGPSGCGKSTLLRCIAGLETPDAGTIAIGERGLWSADQCGRQQAPAVDGLPGPRTVAAHDGGKEHRVSADNPRQ